jgi:hypothetical protein
MNELLLALVIGFAAGAAVSLLGFCGGYATARRHIDDRAFIATLLHELDRRAGALDPRARRDPSRGET